MLTPYSRPQAMRPMIHANQRRIGPPMMVVGRLGHGMICYLGPTKSKVGGGALIFVADMGGTTLTLARVASTRC